MTTNKPHDPELREAIIAEMNREKAERLKCGDVSDKAWPEKSWGYCTWWFKFKIPLPTKVIRKELERMERDGLVTADRSRSNNTLWKLVDLKNHTMENDFAAYRNGGEA